MNQYDGREFVNIGVGEDISIKELAELTAKIIGFDGELAFDSSRPDGTPRKLMDVTRMHELGWRRKTSLNDGIKIAYQDFLKKEGSLQHV